MLHVRVDELKRCAHTETQKNQLPANRKMTAVVTSDVIQHDNICSYILEELSCIFTLGPVTLKWQVAFAGLLEAGITGGS